MFKTILIIFFSTFGKIAPKLTAEIAWPLFCTPIIKQKPFTNNEQELAEQAKYLMLKRPLEITGKSAKPLRKEGAIAHLSALTLRLKSLEGPQWSEEVIQELLKAYVSENDIGFGKIGQPVRAALTGGVPSPDLSWVLTLLGKDEVLGRLSDVIENDFGKEQN